MAGVESRLTQLQQGVLDTMWSTTTKASVGRRLQLPDGRYEIYKAVRPTRPIDFAQEGEFALKLHERRPEAPLSPYYVNLRELPDNLLTTVAETIIEASEGLEIDFVTGIPQAGTPIARRYSEIADLPLANIFGKATSDSGRRIVAQPGAHRGERYNLYILDDLVTEADTKLEAVKVAQELGYSIAGIGVLVDRQQGGRELLEGSGLKVVAPIAISDAFAHYHRAGKVNDKLFGECMDYLNNARRQSGLPAL